MVFLNDIVPEATRPHCSPLLCFDLGLFLGDHLQNCFPQQLTALCLLHNLNLYIYIYIYDCICFLSSGYLYFDVIVIVVFSVTDGHFIM